MSYILTWLIIGELVELYCLFSPRQTYRMYCRINQTLREQIYMGDDQVLTAMMITIVLDVLIWPFALITVMHEEDPE